MPVVGSACGRGRPSGRVPGTSPAALCMILGCQGTLCSQDVLVTSVWGSTPQEDLAMQSPVLRWT